VKPTCIRCKHDTLIFRRYVAEASEVLDWHVDLTGRLIPSKVIDGERFPDISKPYDPPYQCAKCGRVMTYDQLLSTLSPTDLATLTKTKLTL
jgi:hypothetical protein